MDCSPPGSSVHGILQSRILEWVAMPSSKGSSWPRVRTRLTQVPCIGRRVLYCWATRKPPLAWVAIPFSRDFLDSEIEPISLCLLHWYTGSLPLASPEKPQVYWVSQKVHWGFPITSYEKLKIFVQPNSTEKKRILLFNMAQVAIFLQPFFHSDISLMYLWFYG